MKRSFPAILLLRLFIVFIAAAQEEKIPLSHDVYDGWKNISRQQISADGRWISWEASPQTGDGVLYLMDMETGIVDFIARGNRASFSPNSGYMVFYVSQPTSVIRKAKADGLKEDEMPRDSVGIYIFDNTSNRTYGRAGSFALAKEQSEWMVYLLNRKPEIPVMYIYNPVTGARREFNNVTEFSLSANGRLVAFIREKDIVISTSSNKPGGEGGQEETGAVPTSISVFNTVTGTTTDIIDVTGKARSIVTDPKGTRAAFMFSPEGNNAPGSDKQPDIYDLWYWEEGDAAAFPAVTETTPGMPRGWAVSENGTVSFSENGGRLFFGTAERPQPGEEDTLLAEEKYRVDVWHYKDPLIQPQQLAELGREQKRTFSAVYHPGKNRMVQLAGPGLPEVTTSGKGDGNTALGISKIPYLIQNSFESGDYADVYLVDVRTGERTPVLEKHRGSSHSSSLGDARLSPEGNFLVWYSQADSNWHAMPTPGGPGRNISSGIPWPLYDELYDQPGKPGPYGIAAWTADEGYVLIYDRYDIWKVDPMGVEKPVSLTGGYGRGNGIRLRYEDPDQENKSPGARDRIMLSAFNIHNKQSGFYTVRINRPGRLSMLTIDDVRYFTPQKAKDANVIIWRKSTFEQFPDLWVSDMNFGNPRKLSDANPQQHRYKWGTAQTVSWVSFGNDSLQGTLYTPEYIESGRKYPMIVYFYERLSDNLHAHYVPSPSRSTINISYCVSNDYLVFVPDIVYTPGYPGQSAYNAIISGTEAILNQFDFIDRNNLGIQGQSWGGYQIAWLITRTDIFRAAMAGAPVSNMTSAYGGIRWSTGLSRIYQYEETQSRIGSTLWEKPLRYLENSPVFFADKVNTPLLMMHNDNDGAVPWYQGIEYYMALRRLGQPVWMLNYNDEAHNLTRRPNMMDLSERMYSFFDHYLKGGPAPSWMKEGIPATGKKHK